MTDHVSPVEATPWGYALFKHMHDTHGLILTLSELQEIVIIARSLDREPARCPTCSCAPGSWGAASSASG